VQKWLKQKIEEDDPNFRGTALGEKDKEMGMLTFLIMHLKRSVAYAFDRGQSKGEYSCSNDFMVFGQCLHDLDNALLALDTRIQYKRPMVMNQNLLFFLTVYLAFMPYAIYPFLGGIEYFDMGEKFTFVMFNLLVTIVYVGAYTTSKPIANIFKAAEFERDFMAARVAALAGTETANTESLPAKLKKTLKNVKKVYVLKLVAISSLFIAMLLALDDDDVTKKVLLFVAYATALGFMLYHGVADDSFLKNFKAYDRKNAKNVVKLQNESIRYIKYEKRYHEHTCDRIKNFSDHSAKSEIFPGDETLLSGTRLRSIVKSM
jgi:hypothetical protein